MQRKHDSSHRLHKLGQTQYDASWCTMTLDTFTITSPEPHRYRWDNTHISPPHSLRSQLSPALVINRSSSHSPAAIRAPSHRSIVDMVDEGLQMVLQPITQRILALPSSRQQPSVLSVYPTRTKERDCYWKTIRQLPCKVDKAANRREQVHP